MRGFCFSTSLQAVGRREEINLMKIRQKFTESKNLVFRNFHGGLFHRLTIQYSTDQN